MAVVYFIYGLAFFCLGLAIAIYPKRESVFGLANRLWLIAVFGIVHGINEWIDMFILINGAAELPFLKLIRVPLLVISFLCLLEFGIRGITRDGKKHGLLKLIPAFLLAVWAAIVLFSGQRFLMADVWGRYLLGAPGIFLTAYALLLYEEGLRKFELIKVRKSMKISASVFILYGLFSGLVVPDGGFFPNTVLNYDLFLDKLGVPVQVFRSACAVVLTYSFVNVLRIFEWETKDKIRQSQTQLEDHVEKRTAALRELNEQLEAEIADRIKAEESLKVSQKNIETILESTPYGIVIVGCDKVIRYANASALESMGYETPDEIVGKICHQRMCPRAVGECPIIDQGQEVDKSERMLLHKDGHKIPILKSVRRVNIGGEEVLLEAFVDISERKKAEEDKARLEEQLLHAQKMEAIGTLTGGIAHDFNNILTAVIGYGEFLKDEMAETDPRKEYVEMIVASGEKGARLTQSLLAFSRKQIIHPVPVNLNDVVRSAEGLLSRLIGEDIELNITYTDKKLIVRADSVRMEQILMNLGTNARDAMPGGGTLNVSTEKVNLDEEFIKAHGFGIAGSYALIIVSDTGQGIDEKTKELIFEPFFTTKDVGKGTGLGLSVVYGLVKQHGGFIDIYSEPGMGTTFKIYLPLVEAEAAEKVIEPVELKGGSETILLAEDDENVRGLMTRLLERSGYTVLEASNGDESTKLFEKYSDNIDILVFDMVMPVKSGIEAYEDIKRKRPDVKALFISGYPSEILRKKGIKEENLNLITKPVSPSEALSKIREVLDS